MFRQLAVFHGSFGEEAAAAVVDAAALLDELGTLVDVSLLQRDRDVEGTPRFRMLKTIREFAEQQLTASGEHRRARQRHAAYFRALLDRWEPDLAGVRDVAVLYRIENDLDNFRAAVAWFFDDGNATAALQMASTLWWFCLVRGHWSEARQCLRRALPETVQAPPIVRGTALSRAGLLASLMGDLHEAVSLLQASVELCREQGDLVTAGAAGAALAPCYAALGDHERSEAILADSARLLTQTLGDLRVSGWKDRIALVLYILGVIKFVQGDRARAAAALTESRYLFAELGMKWYLMEVSLDLGSVFLARDDVQSAIGPFLQAREVGLALDDQVMLSYVYDGIAATLVALGHPEPAVALFAATQTLRSKLGGPPRLLLANACESARAHARQLLGETEFARAWMSGERLTPEAAFANARPALRSLGAIP